MVTSLPKTHFRVREKFPSNSTQRIILSPRSFCNTSRSKNGKCPLSVVSNCLFNVFETFVFVSAAVYHRDDRLDTLNKLIAEEINRREVQLAQTPWLAFDLVTNYKRSTKYRPLFLPCSDCLCSYAFIWILRSISWLLNGMGPVKFNINPLALELFFFFNFSTPCV